MITKNQKYEVTIESCTQEGYGICRIDGKAVFVKGALAGEIWIILILKVTNTAIWAKGLYLVKESPMRISPDCPITAEDVHCAMYAMKKNSA